MKRYVILFVLFTVAFAKAELPNFRPYVGLDYLYIDIINYGYESNIDGARVKLGAELNQYFALEGHIGAGFSSSDSDQNGIDWEIDKFWGLYARGILPLHERVKLYGLFGITTIELEPSAAGQPLSFNEAGYSYGLGVEFFPLDNLSIAMEFISLIDELSLTEKRDEGEPDVSAVALGAKYYF